ncbi:hypothetical protein AVEN_54665-1 [Araneus ventricosus]|uniref:Uncharacterized protein n=1 Tax=Araneus ventricosus TaxID=182803 RepID=A0A4Y2BNM2_ARAVE|nr:hypothetical protein AVEN_54665-1 [Araneus ventricosus]
MLEIYSYLDGKDDFQYPVDEPMEQISGEKPISATIRQEMKEKYGDRVFFSTVRTRKTVVSFHDASEKILNDIWYNSKSSNEKIERERIARTAGAILLEGMKLMAYGTAVFPPSDNFWRDFEEMVLHTLRVLMDSLSVKKGE